MLVEGGGFEFQTGATRVRWRRVLCGQFLAGTAINAGMLDGAIELRITSPTKPLAPTSRLQELINGKSLLLFRLPKPALYTVENEALIAVEDVLVHQESPTYYALTHIDVSLLTCACTFRTSASITGSSPNLSTPGAMTISSPPSAIAIRVR